MSVHIFHCPKFKCLTLPFAFEAAISIYEHRPLDEWFHLAQPGRQGAPSADTSEAPERGKDADVGVGGQANPRCLRGREEEGRWQSIDENALSKIQISHRRRAAQAQRSAPLLRGSGSEPMNQETPP